MTCLFVAAPHDDKENVSGPVTKDIVLHPIPQPPEHLYGLLGNIPDLDPEFFARSVWRLADLYGAIFRLNLLNRKFIVLSSVELCADALDDDNFEKYTGGILGVLKSGLGDGLFTASSDSLSWARAHRLLMPIFGPMGVRKMFPDMLDIAQQMIMGWDRLGPDNEINSTVDFTRLAFDTIGLCGYGYRFNEFMNGIHPFAVQMADYLKESGRISARTTLETQMRVFSARKYQENIKGMLDLVEEMLVYRKAHPEPDRYDLLNVMLNSADPVTGEKLSDENIKYQMVTFLVAGHETTAGTLAFLFYLLLKNTRTLIKAQQEVDQVLGNDAIEPKHIGQLKYLDACIKETLRFQGPITQIQRVAKKTSILGGKYQINAGEACICSVHLMHRDPAAWGEDVNEYKPERMLDPSKMPHMAWKPFGTGFRSCIGRSFAEQEILISFALILQRFQLEMADPSYNLVLKSTMTVKPDNFSFKVRRRPGKGLMVGFSGNVSSASIQPNQQTRSDQVTRDDSKHVVVLYGSNAGTCKAFADELEQSASSRGYTVESQSLDTATEHISTKFPVVIITSSYEGKPPDNAKKFVSWLESGQVNSSMLTGCRFALFGVGNPEWTETYQRIPKLIDQLMEKGGASKICESAFANIKENAIGDWEDWLDHFWNAIPQHGSADVKSSDDKLVVKVVHSKLVGILAGEEVAQSIVKSNRLLADSSVGPAKKCMDIELPEGATYQPGDYLVVLPLNPERSVARVLKYFKLNPEDVIEISGTRKAFLEVDANTTAFNLFASRVELGNTVTQRQLDTLISCTTAAGEKEALGRLRGVDFKQKCLDKHMTILDVLEDFPSCRLELSQFVDMLKPLSPRQYSISSSPLFEQLPLESHNQPVTASITYDVQEGPAWSGQGRMFHGVASSYLGSLTAGSRVRCFVRATNTGFHLPPDPKTPIIMMAAGTGLAPMRGFLQERAAIARARGNDALGPALLYFGCRDHDKDFIHRDELEAWDRDGIVSLRLAFSQHGAGGASPQYRYVPDRVFAERDEIADLFKEGAKIFVCGSASKLAKSNADACRRAYRERYPGKTEKDAADWFEGIREERYVSDTF